MAGLSLEEASKGICSVSLLSLIERGQRTASPDMLAQIHERLGITDSDSLLNTESVELIQGCLALANDSAERAKEWLPKIKSDSERMILQGLIAEAQGDLALCIGLLEGVVRNGNASIYSVDRAFLALVRAEREQGDYYSAVYWGEQLLDYLKDSASDTTSMQLEARATLASVYCQLGDYAKATELVKSRPNSIETTWDAVVQLWSSGEVAYHQGMYEVATEQTRGAAQLVASLNKKMSQARLINSAIYMSIASSHTPTDADMTDLEAAIQIFRNEKNYQDLAGALNTKASALASLGKSEMAVECAQESIDLCHQIAESRKVEILAANALVLQSCGEHNKAIGVLEQSAEALAKQPKSRLSAKVWTQMAEIYENIGQAAKALECYRNSSIAAGLSAGREAARQLAD